MKILLIDQDVEFGQRLSLMIRQDTSLGCKLTHLATLEEGAYLASRLDFSAVLLGLPTEEKPMLAACEELAAVSPDLRLIVLVRETSGEHSFEELAGIAADVLIKGRFTAAQLLQRVRIAIERGKFQASRGSVRVPPHASRQRIVCESPFLVGVGSDGTATASASSPLTSNSLLDSEFLAAPEFRSRRGSQSLSILHVGDDCEYVGLIQSSLSATMQAQCDVKRVARLSDALQRLVGEAFDAIVVENELPDSRGVATMEWLRPYAQHAPIVVVSEDANETEALEIVKHGAQDCHAKQERDAGDLARSVGMAIVRHQRSKSDFSQERARLSAELTRRATTQPIQPNDRRLHPRYLLARSLIIIPLLPDYQPVNAFQADGISIDFSAEGICFQILGLDRLPTHRLVVGVEGEDGQLHFATVDVRRSVPVPGGLQVGGQFSSIDRDVLRPENMLPHLNPKSHRYETGLSTAALYKWAELGICRPILMDRILACPDCRAVPTLRRGCRACGSVRTASSQLIHHFPCAHVGMVQEFDQGGELVCPKCRQRKLVIGADYEYLSGPYQCLDCNWSDTQLELVGQCLACELRFPIQQAIEEDLIGYHVQRLDPLALVTKH
ncbi:MAG: response regulator [Pirellulaceae bacterium]